MTDPTLDRELRRDALIDEWWSTTATTWGGGTLQEDERNSLHHLLHCAELEVSRRAQAPLLGMLDAARERLAKRYYSRAELNLAYHYVDCRERCLAAVDEENPELASALAALREATR